jgi:hypothetical protein
MKKVFLVGVVVLIMGFIFGLYEWGGGRYFLELLQSRKVVPDTA